MVTGTGFFSPNLTDYPLYVSGEDCLRMDAYVVENAEIGAYNGVYYPDERYSSTRVADWQARVYRKDATHHLYRENGIWYLGTYAGGAGNSWAYTNPLPGRADPPSADWDQNSTHWTGSSTGRRCR